MSLLALAFPIARTLKLPVSRDQAMLLMLAVNELFLGVDTYLAHSLSGTLRPYEWIPIYFGPIAGVLLALAGLLALRQRAFASLLATLVFVASAAVGVLGAYFHIVRTVLPDAPAGAQVTLDLFVLAPPVLGPLAFALVGLLGVSAAWIEDPQDSGRLRLPGGLHLQLPYSKTNAYFFAVCMGILVALDQQRARSRPRRIHQPVAVAADRCRRLRAGCGCTDGHGVTAAARRCADLCAGDGVAHCSGPDRRRASRPR